MFRPMVSFASFLLALLPLVALSQESLVCPTYDASKIKLVTFDVFAALMQWEYSMKINVAEVLPWMSASDVESLVLSWESAYGGALGTTFEEGVTGAYPFSHMVSTSLKSILANMNTTVTRDEFSSLVRTWGNLQPYANDAETLDTLSKSGLVLGMLSNGDRLTLEDNAKQFAPTVTFGYTFSSDFPAAGAFKPVKAIYEQTMDIGYDVSEILHVAGGGNDASGAREAGLFSVYVNHSTDPAPKSLGVQQSESKKSGAVFERFMHPSAKTAGRGTTAPCFEISDLSFLPEVLGL